MGGGDVRGEQVGLGGVRLGGVVEEEQGPVGRGDGVDGHGGGVDEGLGVDEIEDGSLGGCLPVGGKGWI